MNSFWTVTLATLVKDIRLEWRSKDALNSMLFFSLLVVVIFVFSFDPLAEESRHIVGGLIWVAFLFAAVVALNQTWARELRNQVLDAYRVSPAPANALFLAKALGNFIFVSVLEALMVPLFVIFYNLHVLGPAWQLVPIALLGTWALVVNGTFFAAMSLRTRSREMMLPLLLFPISIPAVIGHGRGDDRHTDGRELGSFLHRIASHLRCGVYYSLSGFVRDNSARGMKRLFPILAVLTAVFLAYALYQALVVAPTDALQGEVYRIIYYHVPSAWTAFLLFFINFIASIQYLVSAKPSTKSAAKWIVIAIGVVGVIATFLPRCSD